MGIEVSEGPAEGVEPDVVAVPVGTEGVVRAAGASLEGRLEALREAGALTGEWQRVAILHGERPRLAAVGLGEPGTLDADAVRDAGAAIARDPTVGGTLAWLLDGRLSLPLEEQARAVVEGIVLGGYDPGRWKTSEPARRRVDRLVLVGGDASVLAAAQRAERVAHWTNRARDLVNRPPNDLTPERLA